jgi:hypothetical protein
VRPSTEATHVASTARADGQTGGSVDANERVRPTGGAAQDTRGGGLYAWTEPTGVPRPSGRCQASPVEWPATGRTSTTSARARFGEAQGCNSGTSSRQARPPAEGAVDRFDGRVEHLGHLVGVVSEYLAQDEHGALASGQDLQCGQEGQVLAPFAVDRAALLCSAGPEDLRQVGRGEFRGRDVD